MKFEELNLLDIGNTMELSGVVYESDTDAIIMYFPETVDPVKLHEMFPTLEEWQQVIRQSDLKEVELVGEDKLKKIILRKSTRQIETSVMWEVFRRDNYACRYCGNNKVPMTVDHIILWEEGGPSIEKNLICSCKKCNNTRGNMQYEDWLESEAYQKRGKTRPEDVSIRNALVLDMIPVIREGHMRVHKRKR